ncbi:MAG TPA: flagellar motor stator protein MotA [Bryobacteraceae bacterium]|nr:flagellar motor stator protein MotA [Bryobacteraceae bacterium]
MFAIIGIVVVLGSVIGGYLLSHGNMKVLFQPYELLIILGAALGTLLIANPLSVVMGVVKGTLGILKSSPYSKAFYLEQLKMLNDIFNYARKNGLVKLEADVEEPDKSQLFTKYPKFVKDHHAVHFVCDTLRMSISGGVGHFEIDQMMEMDMEIHHHENTAPVTALTTVSDALPGLGIVAAVLGIVITMGALGGPPEEIGHHVAASLVGTFLGILLSYGFFGPIAGNMTRANESQREYYNFLRIGLISFIRGAAPILAVEFARRSIPAHERPSFKEMEKACKGGGGA